MSDLERGFISKAKILKYVSEEEIFSLVFGYKPLEYRYVTSPFREDDKPGAWFQRDITKGRLRFSDFANTDVINGIKMNNIDCFDAVQVYFKLSNFYKTLEFIKKQLIDGKDLSNNIKVFKPQIRERVIINTDIRAFEYRDQLFWQSYGITKQNLIDDQVFAIKKFEMLNTRSGDITKRVNDLCYCFSDFDEERKKLYRPQKKGSSRFLTNCIADDIGGINSLPRYGQLLVIKKSYKDYRVIKNHDYSTIWFQNEGMIPSMNILIPVLKRFTKVVVFFDNDNAGILAGKKVRDVINSYVPGKASSLFLPPSLNESYSITDPSDLYKIKGSNHLQEFLNNNL